MPKATKADKTQHHNAQMLVFATSDRVYSFAATQDTRFNDCLAAAPEPVQAAYRAAVAALTDLEARLVNAGKAYRDTFGHCKLNA